MPNWREIISGEARKIQAEKEAQARKEAATHHEASQQRAQEEYQEQQRIQEHLRRVPGIMERFEIKDFFKEMRRFWPRKSYFEQTKTGYYLSDKYSSKRVVITWRGGSNWDSYQDSESLNLSLKLCVDCLRKESSDGSNCQCLHLTYGWDEGTIDYNPRYCCKGSHGCFDFINHPELVESVLKDISRSILSGGSKIPWSPYNKQKYQGKNIVSCYEEER